MATTSLLVAVGFAGLLFLVFGEMPRRAPPGDRPWMRDPTAHPRWNIRDTFRDIGIALLTGAVVGSVFFVAEETREDERTLRAEIVENTRFVRQLSIEFPDQPKPLTGSMLAGASLGGLNLAGADLSGAVLSGVVFTGTDLSDTVLDGICWVEASPPVWPEGFDPPAGGSEACPD